MGSSKHWNNDQIQYLHDKWGVRSIKAIAKHLNKSVSAIKQKARREGLSDPMLHFDGITLSELMKALNKSYSKTVESWIGLYELPVRSKVFASTKAVKVIRYEDFWKWAEDHKELLNFAKVEENILGPEPDWVKVKRSADKMRSQRTWLSTPWSKQEDERLLQLVKQPSITYPELARLLNRTESSIKRRLYDLNSKFLPVRLNNHVKYTNDEVKLLRQMATAGYGYETIAERLGKSALGVRGKLERMNFDFKARKFKEVANK